MRTKILGRLDRMKNNKDGKRWFSLPSPIDLGWSAHNALEDAEWSDEPRGKTWQDWHAHVKKLHPIKYFIVESVPTFLRRKVWWPIKRPLENGRYWLVSHLIPSRRYHMLDLRQKGGYRYGWRDVPEKMLYAMFNLLGEYLNEEHPHDLTGEYTREQIEADANLREQQGAIDEARIIYNWWLVGRKQELKQVDDMRHLWWTAKKAKDPKKDAYWAQLKELEDNYEKKTDEMVQRLMKIRRTLWT